MEEKKIDGVELEKEVQKILDTFVLGKENSKHIRDLIVSHCEQREEIENLKRDLELLKKEYEISYNENTSYKNTLRELIDSLEELTVDNLKINARLKYYED